MVGRSPTQYFHSTTPLVTTSIKLSEAFLHTFVETITKMHPGRHPVKNLPAAELTRYHNVTLLYSTFNSRPPCCRKIDMEQTRIEDGLCKVDNNIMLIERPLGTSRDHTIAATRFVSHSPQFSLNKYL